MQSGLENRKVLALETIARRLGAIEECLITIVDGNDKSLRMKNINLPSYLSVGRAYSELEKKIRKK